jgi:hypothetical protein
MWSVADGQRNTALSSQWRVKFMGRSCFGGDLKLLFEFNRIRSLAARVLTRVRRAGSRLGDKAIGH